jgi:hypothetical protein
MVGVDDLCDAGLKLAHKVVVVEILRAAINVVHHELDVLHLFEEVVDLGIAKSTQRIKYKSQIGHQGKRGENRTSIFFSNCGLLLSFSVSVRPTSLHVETPGYRVRTTHIGSDLENVSSFTMLL